MGNWYFTVDEMDDWLTFEELYDEIYDSLGLSKVKTCEVCKGRGKALELEGGTVTKYKTCLRCKGEGSVKRFPDLLTKRDLELASKRAANRDYDWLVRP